MISQEYRKSLKFLLKWTVIAVFSGFLGVGVVRSFVFVLTLSQGLFREAVSYLPLWTAAGALITGALLYRISPESSGEGIPAYLRALKKDKGMMNTRATFVKYFAALLTLSSFGNGGVVGPLGRVNSGLVSFAARQLKIFRDNPWDLRTASICGFAAIVGTVFHSSIGGGIFAVEIIQKNEMRYRDLFPAILSSATAVFVSKLLGFSSFYPINAPNVFMDTRFLWGLILFAVITGFLGKGYNRLYSWISRLFNRDERGFTPVRIAKIVAGAAAAALIAWHINPFALGTSRGLVEGLFTTDVSAISGRMSGILPLAAALVITAVVKAVGNCLTVGSGLSAGFTGPAALIGMLFGSAFAHLIGVPPMSADYAAFVAAGFAGMLASSMNIPLAAAIIAIESFGLQYSFPAGIAAIIGFQINRHQTIYDYSTRSDPEEKA